MEINGQELAKEIINELKKEREKYDDLKIAAFLIGETEEKNKFLNMKKKVAEELNIELRIYKINPDWSRRKIRKYISQVIKKKTLHGGIVQLPLPEKLPQQYILNSIPPEKDIDCLSVKNLGKYFANQFLIRPPSVEVVDFLAKKYEFKFDGTIVVIVGYGNLIGKPLTHYFCYKKATTIVINENTIDAERYFHQADYIISGAGVPLLITTCKKGAVIIDFGIKVIENKIFGDVDITAIKDKAKLYTPTPGGTGPLLTAMLFKNFFSLLKCQ